MNFGQPKTPIIFIYGKNSVFSEKFFSFRLSTWCFRWVESWLITIFPKHWEFLEFIHNFWSLQKYLVLTEKIFPLCDLIHKKFYKFSKILILPQALIYILAFIEKILQELLFFSLKSTFFYTLLLFNLFQNFYQSFDKFLTLV